MGKKKNVQVVQRFLQSLLDRDLASLTALLADDVEWVSPGPKELLPWAGEYHGPEGVMEYYTAFMQGIESTAAEVQELVAQRDKVVVLGRHHGRIRATGKGYDLNWAQVFTVREGKIAAMHSYHDTHLVAEAARSD